MGEMRSYLIVANETLSGEPLRAAIAERVAGGPARFYVVVPATPITHGLTWDEEETKNAAETRLREIITHLQSVGAEADGEVGVRDPVDAAHDALRHVTVDEVILSTLPAGISRWLGQDVPSRLRGSVRVPVAVVTQPKEAAAADMPGGS
jgi:hypothetical protein